MKEREEEEKKRIGDCSRLLLAVHRP